MRTLYREGLYQIRGRVGRSETQAYAYCYYLPDQILTHDAQDRLRAIREFTTLGSGYHIAMRDLEIRGVGNVLGDQQHGHMVAVGFDLYCQMLEESIQELQGKAVETQNDTIVDLNITAFIPDEWVGDRNVKLTEYKRLAQVRSMRMLSLIELEWQDRFGPIPQPAQQLLQLVQLRILATQVGFGFVREDDTHVRLSVPYTLKVWMSYQAKLAPEFASKMRWMPAVAAKAGSLPIITLKKHVLSGTQLLNALIQLLTQLNALHSA